MTYKPTEDKDPCKGLKKKPYMKIYTMNEFSFSKNTKDDINSSNKNFFWKTVNVYW